MIENLLSKMYIEGALMSKSRNIALTTISTTHFGPGLTCDLIRSQVRISMWTSSDQIYAEKYPFPSFNLELFSNADGV